MSAGRKTNLLYGKNVGHSNPEKESFFRQQRKKMESHLRFDSDLVKRLGDPQLSKDALELLTQKANRTDYRTQIFMMLDDNIIDAIFSFMESNTHLMSTLALLSAMLSKDDVRIACRFVNRGLFEYLFSYIDREDLTEVCLNIIGNIIVEEESYAQMILEGRMHRPIICQMGLSIDSGSYKTNKICVNALWVLRELVSVNVTALNFYQQYLQILRASQAIMEQEIHCLIARALEVVYQIAAKELDLVRGVLQPILAKLLEESSPQSQYMRNLLAVIFKLSPIDINYSIVFRNGIFNRKNFSLSLRVLGNILGIEHYEKQLVFNEVWWEQAAQIASTNDREMLIKLLALVPVKGEWIWRILFQFLQQPNGKKIQFGAMKLIEKIMGEQPDVEYLAAMMEKHLIKRKLQELMEDSNPNIRDKSAHILNSLYCSMAH